MNVIKKDWRKKNAFAIIKFAIIFALGIQFRKDENWKRLFEASQSKFIPYNQIINSTGIC